MFLPKVGVAVEGVSSFNWTWPAALNGEPLLSRSRHARVSVRPTVTAGFALSVMLAGGEADAVDVARDAALDRRLPVAEQVVGDAERAG